MDLDFAEEIVAALKESSDPNATILIACDGGDVLLYKTPEGGVAMDVILK